MKERLSYKDKFMGLIGLIVIIIFFIIICYVEHHYSMQGFVVEQTKDVLTVEDKMGLKWHYVTKESFEEKEEIKLYFNNGTTDNTRKDDTLIKIKRLEKKS